jgi:phospholipid/cholesterol/gamma-HCH transport system ATP-binding protein
MIELRDVTVRFGGRAALEGVTVAFRAGELCALLGGPGSGKTTLIKVACLLLRPESGAVLVDGADLAAKSERELGRVRARFGVAFQNLGLFDALTVVDNVALPLARRGVAEAEARARAAAALRSVGLAGAEEKRPAQLSGGMKRRAAFARAVVAEPSFSLYDDPFTGLDPVACARIGQLIARLHRARSACTVVAASDPRPLLPLCDRAVLIEAGRVVFDGTPAELQASAAAEVRRYLGSVPPGAAAPGTGEGRA